MSSCVLCLVEAGNPYAARNIELFSEEGLRLNIASIIAKHLWFKPYTELCPGQQICVPCWEAVRDFHQFYQRIAVAHNRLEDIRKDLRIPAETDADPLPDDVLLKSEEICDSRQVMVPLGTDFYDSEVKVEVHDLDLLPQIEIIEDTPNLSEQTRRLTRRTRQTRGNSAIKATTLIKRESSPLDDDSQDESELPLAVLLSVCLKTNFENEHMPVIQSVQEAPSLKSTDATYLPKKRRGRPKKLKEEAGINKNYQQTSKINKTTVKAEEQESAARFADAQEFLIEGGGQGTDESSISSSESTSSCESWKAEERYAVIPKRIVMKPKKYRKRQKPLVPPKRMTREEIERKNAQQAEYDKVIAKFFEKMPCPRCSLLVKNFGEMKKHFRASHNDDIGYMSCCGRKYHLRKALAEHVYVHQNPEHFKCMKCEKVFQDSRSLEVHEQTHTNPTEPKEKKLLQCDKCPKAFTTKAAFEYHSFSKHVPKSEFKFTCPECNKKLPTERKLKDHMKYTHDPESAIICDKCGKQMRSQSNLKKHHQLEHSEAPRPVPVPMQCEICGTWLRHLAGLKQHMKTIHEDSGGEHRCHICNKTSTNARALKRHIYHNHECERKFKCTMCEKAFKRPQDLREHTSTHTGEVLYTCPNCPMTFFSNANMYKHRQRLHRAEWEADKKKPMPPNIMQQAVGATAAMKIQQAVGASSAFFAHKQVPLLHTQPSASITMNLEK